jgi:ACS family sodium-dependent inorganic phosphate cotransporter
VPVQERSRSLSLVYSGMYTGSMLGLAVSPQMISSWGWPSVFYVFGLGGLLWYYWWDRCAAASPKADPGIDSAELAYITRNTASSAAPTSIPWKLLLSKPATWALIICHFCHNWGTFILLTWMPTYYNQVPRACSAHLPRVSAGRLPASLRGNTVTGLCALQQQQQRPPVL